MVHLVGRGVGNLSINVVLCLFVLLHKIFRVRCVTRSFISIHIRPICYHVTLRYTLYMSERYSLYAKIMEITLRISVSFFSSLSAPSSPTNFPC